MYRLMRMLVGIALGFYFRRIERFHLERVPLEGPLLFTSNHPNSVTDSFVIGASVPRKVSFVATVQLFRFKPLKWLFTSCGVIPINRVRDDPKAMRTVADTFEACYRVLEAGEAIGIFPEGITYDDEQLKEIKSGAARMALELEDRHGGKLGLRIVPVGLTFSAKDIYRSNALVHFGEPLRAADFLDGYAERRKECIRRLTGEIERSIQGLIAHLPELEHARVIAGVKRLYLDRLIVGQRVVVEPSAPPQAETLLMSQRIIAAVERVYKEQPGRAAHFAGRLAAYERWVARLKLSPEHLEQFGGKRKLAWESLKWTVLGILGLPIALYGWLHRLVPVMVIRWAVVRFSQPGKRRSQTATTSIAGGVVVFGLFYGACVGLVHWIFGWPVSLWYALSLPLAGLLAHYYLRELRRFAAAWRTSLVLLRAPSAARRLAAMRNQLIEEIESVRQESAKASA